MNRPIDLPACPQALSRDPFENRPSPDMFYSSSVHQAAWSFVRTALKSGAPYIMVTGDFGAGKTMLSLMLVRALKRRGPGPCVYVSTPAQGYTEVLRRAHVVLGLADPTDGDHPPDPERLRRSLHNHFDEGLETRRLFLVVEDPQDMAPETLEPLLDLPRMPTRSHGSICLFLLGHTSFPAQLRSPKWRWFDARIEQRHHLTGLDERETRAYIAARLECARDAKSPAGFYFTDAALHQVYALSAGNPRAINNLCGTSLTIAVSESRVRIDPGVIARAASTLGYSDTECDQDRSVITRPAHIRSEAGERVTPACGHATDGDVDAMAAGVSVPAEERPTEPTASNRRWAEAVSSAPLSQLQQQLVARLRPMIDGEPWVSQIAAGLAILTALLYLAWPYLSDNPGSAGTRAPATVEKLTEEERRELESLLQALDFQTGPVDGVIDPRTRVGIESYQQMAGLTPADGTPSRALLKDLRAVAGKLSKPR